MAKNDKKNHFYWLAIFGILNLVKLRHPKGLMYPFVTTSNLFTFAYPKITILSSLRLFKSIAPGMAELLTVYLKLINSITMNHLF